MDAPRRRHSLARSTFVLLYDDDDVTNDDENCGDATKRTRVCVEAIDDDAPPQVRTNIIYSCDATR